MDDVAPKTLFTSLYKLLSVSSSTSKMKAPSVCRCNFLVADITCSVLIIKKKFNWQKQATFYLG